MIRRDVYWFGNYRTGARPSTAVCAAIGTVSLSAIFGVVAGDLTTRICGLAFLMAVLANWAKLSQASLHSLNNELEKHKQLVSRYSKALDESHPMYRVIHWEQVAHIINRRGDTKEFIISRTV